MARRRSATKRLWAEPVTTLPSPSACSGHAPCHSSTSCSLSTRKRPGCGALSRSCCDVRKGVTWLLRHKLSTSLDSRRPERLERWNMRGVCENSRSSAIGTIQSSSRGLMLRCSNLRADCRTSAASASPLHSSPFSMTSAFSRTSPIRLPPPLPARSGLQRRRARAVYYRQKKIEIIKTFSRKTGRDVKNLLARWWAQVSAHARVSSVDLAPCQTKRRPEAVLSRRKEARLRRH